MIGWVDAVEGGAALALCLTGCVTDLRSRRIPNWLTFGGALCGLLFHLGVGGPSGAIASGEGWLVGALLFAPVFLVGGLGAGDIKLLGALGAWLGPGKALYMALFTGIAGGVMAIVVMLVRGYTRTMGRNLFLMATSWRLGIAAVPGLTLDDAKGPRLAYALPIAAGTVLTLWLR
jgi:prepilin peptidase CpaA